MIRGPHRRAGSWVWSGGGPDGVEVRFVGRDGPPGGERRTALDAAGGGGVALAAARQVHSAVVLEAHRGDSGTGDALVTAETGLALSVVTADCVPVLISGAGLVAAVHAGWRGIAGGVVAATMERLRGAALGDAAAAEPATWVAWVGPAIGGCCYEVSDEVAQRVAAASSGEAVLRGSRDRPHLDLATAVIVQLAACGVGLVRPVLRCTRCEADHLHSYRREGAGGGRNHAFIWRHG